MGTKRLYRGLVLPLVVAVVGVLGAVGAVSTPAVAATGPCTVIRTYSSSAPTVQVPTSDTCTTAGFDSDGEPLISISHSTTLPGCVHGATSGTECITLLYLAPYANTPAGGEFEGGNTGGANCSFARPPAGFDYYSWYFEPDPSNLPSSYTCSVGVSVGPKAYAYGADLEEQTTLGTYHTYFVVGRNPGAGVPRSGTPTAAFSSAQAEPATDPGEYQFTSTSTDPVGSALDTSWSFGDGATGAGVSVLHSYTKPGTYTATLTVRAADGSTASVSHPVVVAAPQLQTDVSFVDAHGTVLSAVTPKIGDTVRVRLTVSTTQGVGAVSGITFAGGAPLAVTPSAAASIGVPSPPLPGALTLAPDHSVAATFPVTVATGGPATFTSTPSGVDAAGNTVTGTTGRRSYSVSGMTVTMSVSPATFAMKEDVHGPTPVDVTVTETVTNTGDASISAVTVRSLEPQRVDAGELLAVTYKSGADPDDPKLMGNGLVLQPIPGHGSETITAVYTVADDGKVDFTSLVTAAGADGSTLRATGTTRLEADPKYYLRFASHVVRPRAGLLPAGSPIVVTGTVTNLTDSDVETLQPMYAQSKGNAGLQSFAWNSTGTDPQSFTPAGELTLDPGESRDFILEVLTAYSEPVVGASPLVQQPASGGTSATVSFTPWVTVKRDDGTSIETDRVDTTGSDSSSGDIVSTEADLSHRVSIDDSIALPQRDPVAAVQGVLRGGIQGVWNGASGMLTGLIGLPGMSASTLLAVVQYQDRVWASFSPEQKQQFTHDIGLQVASVLLANYDMAKEGLPALVTKASDASYQYFTKVENESRVGTYSDVVALYSSFAGDAVAQVALPVAIGKLASSGEALQAVEATQGATDARAATITESVGDSASVEQAFTSVQDVPSGVDLSLASDSAMYGVSSAEFGRLQGVADEYNVLLVIRSRAASSLKWIRDYAALLKPEAIKIKSVSALDTRLGYSSAWEGSLVFKEPQPLIDFRAHGGDLSELTRAFVEQHGFEPGTSEYDNAVARVEERIEEWNKYSATYAKWNEQKWVNTSFNWKGNAMRDPTVRGTGRFSGFRLEPVPGEQSTYVMKMYNPRTGTYVPITGDIDPIAFTHVDGTPLTREEHAAVVNELRTDPLLQAQHGESATYVDGGVDFIAKQFKTGEAALMIAPGRNAARTVRFDKTLSVWKSPTNYHLVWEGGFVDAGANRAVTATLQVGLRADQAAAAGAAAEQAQALPGNGTPAGPNVGRCAVTYGVGASPTVMTAAGTLGTVEGATVVSSALEQECMTDGPVVDVQVSPATVSSRDVPAGAEEIPIASSGAYGQKSSGTDGFQVGQQVAVDPGGPDAETGTIAAFGSIILAAPLRHAHPAGTVVLTIGSSHGHAVAASGSGIADTGVHHAGSEVAVGVLAVAVGALLTVTGTVGRRRRTGWVRSRCSGR